MARRRAGCAPAPPLDDDARAVRRRPRGAPDEGAAARPPRARPGAPTDALDARSPPTRGRTRWSARAWASRVPATERRAGTGSAGCSGSSWRSSSCSTSAAAGTSAASLHDRALSGEERRAFAATSTRTSSSRRSPARRSCFAPTTGRSARRRSTTDRRVRAPLGGRPRDGRRGARGRRAPTWHGPSSSSTGARPRRRATAAELDVAASTRAREEAGVRRRGRDDRRAARRAIPPGSSTAEGDDVGRSWCTATRCRGWTTSGGSRPSRDAGTPRSRSRTATTPARPRTRAACCATGETEWEDLEAAVRYALDQRVRRRGPVRRSRWAAASSRRSCARSELAERGPGARARRADARLRRDRRRQRRRASRWSARSTCPRRLTWRRKRSPTSLRYDVDWSELDYLGDPHGPRHRPDPDRPRRPRT